MKFTYRCGQTPLPGYTIKRGIGWGGFGEVYFAVSEGGKEVALKWIRSNLDIELRGVQQCLNLKHPNLVHLYDLRTDSEGNHWLVMEYVAGEPLSVILARHPDGVAAELACEWFEGIAAGVQSLHEHGIVHRDLKPGNIFLEHGFIKVGDYGLCKFIGDSQNAGLTKNVGTVHYMAPEISTGNYNRNIDIYAAGVILYEMLTGKLPFEGESAGEILMKHMTATPNLAFVPREFRPVLEQALDKNPAYRFQNLGDMSKKLTATLRRQAEPVERRPAPTPLPPPLPKREKIPVATLVDEPTPAVAPPSTRARWGELSGMLLWAVAFSALLSAGWALVFGQGDWSRLPLTFYVTLAGSWAVLIPSKLWPVVSAEDSWSRRLLLMTLGFGVGTLALWLEGYQFPLPGTNIDQAEVLLPWNAVEAEPMRRGFFAAFPDNRSMPVLGCYLSYYGLMFLVLRWWRTTEARRSRRFSIMMVVGVALWAFMLLFLLPGAADRSLAFFSMVLTASVCQLASPWKEPTPARGKRLRLGYA